MGCIDDALCYSSWVTATCTVHTVNKVSEYTFGVDFFFFLHFAYLEEGTFFKKSGWL